MSARSEAKWLAAYRVADTLYTTQECGCLALILVDLPDVVRDSKAELLEQALKGRTLHRIPRIEGRVDLPPLNCAAHRKGVA